MRADHAMPGQRRPPYHATRIWVKRDGRWRETPWYSAIGPDYIAQAFTFAQGPLLEGEVIEVRERERHWQQLGINSVPAVIIDDRHLISGGQPPEVFERALRELAAA